MLMQVCLLLLSIGVYTSYAGGSEPTTADPLFSELGVFPDNFNSRFPDNSEFFTIKIFMYLFFNLFTKYFGEKEPIKFWTKFNHNDFNRVAIDAAFYEYLTKFADRKMKNFIFNPLASSHEDFAIDRIGEYLDSLSATEVPVDRPEIRKKATKDCKQRFAKCSMVPVQTPIVGIPGKDFPNYCEIPATSFTCADKLVPGIYADVETGCQVFHACWPGRWDSFLCPIGTTFNQALLTCDFWHESDCSSSPLLFAHSPSEGSTPESAESTTPVYDETSTTSESTTFAAESDIPEYDGTCQSLLSKPLKLHMKFLPAKCEVTSFRPATPKMTRKSNKCDGKSFDPLLLDILSGPFREMFKSILKAAELGSAMQLAEKERKLKMEFPTGKLHSRVKSAGSKVKHSNVHTTKEKIHYPTITDTQDKSTRGCCGGVVERSTFKASSQGKVEHGHSVRRSTLLKRSTPKEDKINRVFEAITKSLELGGKVVNEGLPLVEKIVLDSHRKKTQS